MMINDLIFFLIKISIIKPSKKLVAKLNSHADLHKIKYLSIKGVYDIRCQCIKQLVIINPDNLLEEIAVFIDDPIISVSMMAIETLETLDENGIYSTKVSRKKRYWKNRYKVEKGKESKRKNRGTNEHFRDYSTDRLQTRLNDQIGWASSSISNGF
ncbi:hypothetical protein V6R21_10890 [Limibacter armeniacum]|uniref:hypothetical protein n=1 Tax=Limibacter armeniacum TaxID=466084 RepID=UPI002FE6772E